MFIDVHGDEELPHNFFAGAQGVSNWSPQLAKMHTVLATAYQKSNPDFGNLDFDFHGTFNNQKLATKIIPLSLFPHL